MSALEAALEEFFRKQVRLAGGVTIKLAPTVRGIPDRLAVFPGGRFWFVELKTSRGRLSSIQQHWHQRLLDQTGVRVSVLYGKEEIARWVNARVDERGPQNRKSGRPKAAPCDVMVDGRLCMIRAPKHTVHAARTAPLLAAPLAG